MFLDIRFHAVSAVIAHPLRGVAVDIHQEAEGFVDRKLNEEEIRPKERPERIEQKRRERKVQIAQNTSKRNCQSDL